MTEQQLKDLSNNQIQRIYDSVKDIINKEQFADIVEQVKQDEEREEKGTLALEKKKRPVDCTVYAQYRQLSVDQIGEGSGVNSLFTRLLEAIAAMPGSPATHSAHHILSHLLVDLSFERVKAYADDLSSSETKILDDLCLFISKIGKATFPAIADYSLYPAQFGKYSYTYRAIWEIISEGAIALQLLGFNSPDNEMRIDKAISDKATKISGKPKRNERHTPFCFISESLMTEPKTNQAPLLDDTQIEGQQTFDELEQAIVQKSSIDDMISIAAKRIKSLDMPLDKVNHNVWSLLEKDTGRQLRFNMAEHNSKKRAIVIYSIDFENLNDISITKRLTPYDKLLYVAAGALFKAGFTQMTYKQLYHAMGYDGLPGSADVEKMAKSLLKMRIAQIFISNEDEAQTLKNRVKFTYDGSLLPNEIIRAEVNGKIVDGVVRLHREPPLLTFARKRTQITTIPRAVLTAPLNKTDQNIAIYDCLIERVVKAKKGTLSPKILFSYIAEYAKITDKKALQRLKGAAGNRHYPQKTTDNDNAGKIGKAETILKHFVDIGYIKSYSKSDDGILIDPQQTKNLVPEL